MPETIDEILAPTDLSRAARGGMEEALTMARRFGAHVTVLYVTEDDLPPIIIGMDEEERKQVLEEHADRGRVQLEKEIRSLDRGDLDVDVAVLVGRPGASIARFAEERGTDLIVMASHGRGFLGQVFLGSTTTNVLHRARCPVLVVPVDRS